MKHLVCFVLVIVLATMALDPDCRASSGDDDQETSHQISLADLAGYRAALSGKPTAPGAKGTDPVAQVTFKDLWNRADDFRGRRVTVQGRVVRTFRQGPLGSFPALVEAWITSPKGDPFCVVFPQPGLIEEKQARSGEAIVAPTEKPAGGSRADGTPGPGRTVRFTGTFLKVVRYVGADGARLAPLIVGDGQPIPIGTEPIESQEDGTIRRSTQGGDTPIRLTYWALGLAVAGLVAVSLARWHLRGLGGRAQRRIKSADLGPDPPLEFIEPPQAP
jgi:hypothetical protein